MDFEKKIDALRVEDMADVERSFTELKEQNPSFVPGFAQLLTGCAAVCVSSMKDSFAKYGGISSSVDLEEPDGSGFTAEIRIERTCSLPSFFSEEKKNYDPELMTKLKSDLKKYLALFDSENARYEASALDGDASSPEEKEAAVVLSKMLRYATVSYVPYGDYSWNLCSGGELYALRLIYERVEKRGEAEAEDILEILTGGGRGGRGGHGGYGETTYGETVNSKPRTYVYRVSSVSAGDEQKEERKKEPPKPEFSGSGIFGVVVAAVVYSMILYLMIYGLNMNSPEAFSGVREKQNLTAELRLRAEGKSSRENCAVSNMDVSKLITLLKRATEDEETMKRLLNAEPEIFETPVELEIKMEKVAKAFSAAADAEFESLLRGATTEELKSYLKTAETLFDSTKKEGE